MLVSHPGTDPQGTQSLRNLLEYSIAGKVTAFIVCEDTAEVNDALWESQDIAGIGKMIVAVAEVLNAGIDQQDLGTDLYFQTPAEDKDDPDTLIIAPHPNEEDTTLVQLSGNDLQFMLAKLPAQLLDQSRSED